jgi:O-antigen/teichoic acid export membrane protein
VKISKFFKDIISTGFSQIGILIFGILLLKFMSMGIDTQDFGIFMLIRKWVPVLMPIFTLNISIGLVKYVSSQREHETVFLRVSLLTALGLMGGLAIGLLFFHDWFSFLLFNSEYYSSLVFLLVFFVFANILHLITYSYFRGQLNMTRANVLRLLFYGFPVLLSLGLMVNSETFSGTELLYIFFGAYSLFGILLGIVFLWHDVLGKVSLHVAKGKQSLRTMYLQSRSLFTYSLSRIPTVLCNALIFGLPAFLAVHYLSLEKAGYVAIVVSVVRLLEVFAMPFNMIFLPKFSSLKEEGNDQHIVQYSNVVISFVITFLPMLSIFIFGLSRFIILLWFGPGFMLMDNINSVAVAILFSMFYLSFALIRGILDGLYMFPYNDFISFSGVVMILFVAFFRHGSVFELSTAFGMGLLMLGVVSIGILVWKVGLHIPWKSVSVSIVLSLLLGACFFFIDRLIMDMQLNPYYALVVFLLYRVPFLGAIWWFYWRRQLWFREVMGRLLKPANKEHQLRAEY